MTIDANELPRGWVTSNLEGITTAVSTNGKKVKTKDAQSAGEFPVIDQGAAECAGYLDDESLVIHASVDQPIVLFGDHTRIVKYIERDFIPGADGTKLIQAKSGIQPKYLHYLVAAAEVPDRGYGRHFHHLKEIELPVAPAAEQKRIADKLDTVLTRVDAVNTRLARVAPLLKRFRQSVLAAATSGRLTEDFAIMGNLEPWKQMTIGELVTIKNGRAFPSSSYSNDGIRLLRPGNLHASGLVSWTEKNTVCLASSFAVEFPDYVLGSGELLMNLTAQSLKDDFLGRACLKQGAEPALLNQRICAFYSKLSYDIRPYLFIYFRSPVFRGFVSTLDSGTLIKHMHTKQLLTHFVPTPGQQEQTEIVRRVETLFAFADRLEARLAQAQTAATRLTPALLAKAFRGELVPQDPNDETAAELLRRLSDKPIAVAKSGRTKKVI